jgi:hypothetical protein
MGRAPMPSDIGRVLQFLPTAHHVSVLVGRGGIVVHRSGSVEAGGICDNGSEGVGGAFEAEGSLRSVDGADEGRVAGIGDAGAGG